MNINSNIIKSKFQITGRSILGINPQNYTTQSPIRQIRQSINYTNLQGTILLKQTTGILENGKRKMCLGICKSREKYKAFNLGESVSPTSDFNRCRCYDSPKKQYSSKYMKFYDECLEGNAMTQKCTITAFEMYEIYKKWYLNLYHSTPPENMTDLMVQLNNFTPLIDYYDNTQFSKDKIEHKIQRWIGVKVKN